MLPRQVSWLTGQCFISAFPGPIRPSGVTEMKLAAYSCGGSTGLAARTAHRFPS